MRWELRVIIGSHLFEGHGRILTYLNPFKYRGNLEESETGNILADLQSFVRKRNC